MNRMRALAAGALRAASCAAVFRDFGFSSRVWCWAWARSRAWVRSRRHCCKAWPARAACCWAAMWQSISCIAEMTNEHILPRRARTRLRDDLDACDGVCTQEWRGSGATTDRTQSGRQPLPALWQRSLWCRTISLARCLRLRARERRLPSAARLWSRPCSTGCICRAAERCASATRRFASRLC